MHLHKQCVEGRPAHCWTCVPEINMSNHAFIRNKRAPQLSPMRPSCPQTWDETCWDMHLHKQCVQSRPAHCWTCAPEINMSNHASIRNKRAPQLSPMRPSCPQTWDEICWDMHLHKQCVQGSFGQVHQKTVSESIQQWLGEHTEEGEKSGGLPNRFVQGAVPLFVWHLFQTPLV